MNQIICGEALEVLKSMEANTVNCVVTSPPYYGLRDYQVKNQLGLESTPAEYVSKLVGIFQQVRRVLRADGVLWLNLGDSYGGVKQTGRNDESRLFVDGFSGSAKACYGNNKTIKSGSTKSKNLLGIPWRVAFALQDDGWYLRQDIIWAKKNPMPESVQDRCTKAHEYIFLMTKQARYFYDAEAIKETSSDPESHKGKRKRNAGTMNTYDPNNYKMRGSIKDGCLKYGQTYPKRNKRSVWTISTKPYSGAHYATFPPELPEICIKAGCPENVCAECGAAWVRVVERKTSDSEKYIGYSINSGRCDGGGERHGGFYNHESKTTGFKSSCKCNAGKKPGVVLDPFSGAGTTGLVAARFNRDYIGIEINPKDVKRSKKRLYNDEPLFYQEVL